MKSVSVFVCLALMMFSLGCGSSKPRATPEPPATAQVKTPELPDDSTSDISAEDPDADETDATNTAMATDLVEAFASGDQESVSEFTAGPVKIQTKLAVAGGTKDETLTDSDAFQAWLARSLPCFVGTRNDAKLPKWCTAREGLDVQGSPACDAECCTFLAEEAKEVMVGRNSLYLEQVCFANGQLASIRFIDGQ